MPDLRDISKICGETTDTNFNESIVFPKLQKLETLPIRKDKIFAINVALPSQNLIGSSVLRLKNKEKVEKMTNSIIKHKFDHFQAEKQPLTQI